MNYRQRYGDWALILGGSEGLGKAIAVELARRGMNVALAARRKEQLVLASREIAERFGVATKTIEIDLAEGDLIAMIERGTDGAEVAFVVYNAAAEPHGEFLSLALDEHLANIAVNVTAPTRIVHHFGRAMVARGKGGIVLCSSLACAQGLYQWVSYGAAKAYENILGEGLWYELGEKGVDACTLMIGTTWTESFQRTQKRLGGIFAGGREPANRPDWMALPQLPEEAAANLFAQIDREWLPVVYANPEDQARTAQMKNVSRADLVRISAQAQRNWYSSPPA